MNKDQPTSANTMAACNILDMLEKQEPQPPAESQVPAASPLAEALAADSGTLLNQEARRIMQQRPYQDIGGSSIRKMRFLLHRLATSSELPAGAKALIDRTALAGEGERLFNLEEIPALSVWHGNVCTFLFDSTDSSKMSFSYTAAPAPKGRIGLTPEPGQKDCWRFSYSPAEGDTFPFSVTITADPQGQANPHSFIITPLPHLPPEHIVFDATEHTHPGPVDFLRPINAEEQVEHTYLADKAFVFNYKRPSLNTPLSLRKVHILGEVVVLDKDNDEYGLYATYHGATDIEELHVTAHSVIIRSPLHLPQSDITINARELRFESAAAQLKTTPLEKKDVPQLGKPGADGLDAGNITLNITRFELDDEAQQQAALLDLTGGKGQAGGVGKDGTEGASMPSYGRTMQWKDSGIHFKKTAPSGYQIVYEVAYCTCAIGIPIKAFSRGNPDGWPTNGTSATPSGKPGEGGKGGNLVSSCDISIHAVLGGGQAGAAAAQPRGYYRGGSPGYPSKAIKYKANYCFSAGFKELGRHTTTAGKNAPIAHPVNPSGAMGTFVLSGNPHAWITPLLLHKRINHIKDDYLSSRISAAADALRDHLQAIDEYTAADQWQALDSAKQLEIEHLCDDMHTLLHRIGNNLDYFGHPAGWTPLLSFEINRTIFDNAVDSAADILYLAYNIKNKAAAAEKQFQSLSAMRKQLEKDIAMAVDQFNSTVARIPQLQNTAENLHSRTLETQYRLKAKETELAQKAEEEVRPPAWIVGARLGLKISGTILTMVPVYQPAMGAIGGGLNLLSDFDPDKPWDTIIGAADVTSSFLNSSFDNAAQDLKQEMDSQKLRQADPSGDMRKKMQYLDRARQSSAALSAGLMDLQQFVQKNSAPQTEIEAELEKLKSQSNEYQALVEEIRDLVRRKGEYVEELAAVMQNVGELSLFISRSILAMDAMSVDMEQVREGLDNHTIAYVDDMERRTYDRLLEYHYYMAKAYEYRMLKPYTHPLDFHQLIQRLEKVAKVKTWEELDGDAFRSIYTAVYKERLADIANEIFHEYNNQPKENSNTFGYLLSQEELDTLNAGKPVAVNLAQYLPNEENLRMVNIGIQMEQDNQRKGQIVTSPASGSSYPRNAYLDLTFTHPGISRIRSGSNTYQFQHPFVDHRNPLTWKARYEPESDVVTHSVPSAASASLLKSLLKGDALADLMMYSRPSVLADLQITRSGYPNEGSGIRLERLKLELIYDYFKADNALIDKHVLITVIKQDSDKGPLLREATFTPYIRTDRQDINRRQDGRGRFLRVYQRSWDDRLTFTAQPAYGSYRFNQWTDATGNPLPLSKGNTLSADLRSSQLLCAQYIAEDVDTEHATSRLFALPNASALLRHLPQEKLTDK